MAANAGACGHPSRLAAKKGEHLRMTVANFVSPVRSLWMSVMLA
jgi:hypothetical protein